MKKQTYNQNQFLDLFDFSDQLIDHKLQEMKDPDYRFKKRKIREEDIGGNNIFLNTLSNAYKTIDGQINFATSIKILLQIESFPDYIDFRNVEEMTKERISLRDKLLSLLYKTVEVESHKSLELLLNGQQLYNQKIYLKGKQKEFFQIFKVLCFGKYILNQENDLMKLLQNHCLIKTKEGVKSMKISYIDKLFKKISIDSDPKYCVNKPFPELLKIYNELIHVILK